jgi:hypothetical protein
MPVLCAIAPTTPPTVIWARRSPAMGFTNRLHSINSGGGAPDGGAAVVFVVCL